ncbi:hypothetical protein ACWC0C_12625 [Streptomyces sp. NPDC001709]
MPRAGVVRLGFTGHRAVPASLLPYVRSRMAEMLGGQGRVEVVTSLAAGADQIFAEVALGRGVPVTAVIPGMDFEGHLGDAETRAAYRRLLRACAARVDLPVEATHEAAYRAAGRWIVEHADRLIAVWDGCPARGPGGTGDVVAYARASGVPVTILWQTGVHRD